jgi:hypothetical protein
MLLILSLDKMCDVSYSMSERSSFIIYNTVYQTLFTIKEFPACTQKIDFYVTSAMSAFDDLIFGDKHTDR